MACIWRLGEKNISGLGGVLHGISTPNHCMVSPSIYIYIYIGTCFRMVERVQYYPWGIAYSMGVKNLLGVLSELERYWRDWPLWFSGNWKMTNDSNDVEAESVACDLESEGANVFVAGTVAIILLALSPYIYFVPRQGVVIEFFTFFDCLLSLWRHSLNSLVDVPR